MKTIQAFVSIAALLGPALTLDGADSPVRWEKRVLTDKYYCDGINCGDFNRDSKVDIVAGPFWYEGPEFKTKHEIYPAKEFPKPPSPTDSLYSFVHDFNGDGWPDVLVVGRVHLHQHSGMRTRRASPATGRNTSSMSACRRSRLRLLT